MQADPLLSVVMATYNRCDTLKVSLRKLAEQTVPAEQFDVLVVDDGSPDRTREVVESMIPSVPYPLRYLRHANRGPGYTQNRGIREARGRLVLLMADDIWATPDLVARHLAVHGDHPEESAAVLGKVVQSPELPGTVMHRHWDPFKYYLFDGRNEVEPIHFLACNISCKRKFLVENGLFLERRAAAHEDIELGYRLGRKGLRIFYTEEALAHHYHEETLDGACRRAYERGRNFDLLAENIPASLIYPAYRLLVPQAGAKALLKLFPREFPRATLFNRWTVPWVWLPLLKRAETNKLAAKFARLSTYRGVVGHYFRKGFFENRRYPQDMKGVPGEGPSTPGP